MMTRDYVTTAHVTEALERVAAAHRALDEIHRVAAEHACRDRDAGHHSDDTNDQGGTP